MTHLSERPEPLTRASVLHVEADLVIGACGPIHLTYYRGPLNLARLDVADTFHQRLIRKFGRTSVLGFLEPGIPVPPSDVRERSAALIKQNGALVAAAGLVIPGEGFWVSAARGVVTASFVLARNPYPMKCFGDVGDAARYVLDALSERTVTFSDVVSGMQALRGAR